MRVNVLLVGGDTKEEMVASFRASQMQNKRDDRIRIEKLEFCIHFILHRLVLVCFSSCFSLSLCVSYILSNECRFVWHIRISVVRFILYALALAHVSAANETNGTHQEIKANYAKTYFIKLKTGQISI